MFNVGGGELLVILLIALMVLGPDRLPGFAKKAGKVMGDIRRVSQGFQTEIREAMDFDDKPSAARPASPITPRLVDPPTPPGAPDSIETTATDSTPPTTPSPTTSPPTTPSPSTPSPTLPAPEANGDEPASGSSAA
jgi:sec-independent protein translocase protein TatB